MWRPSRRSLKSTSHYLISILNSILKGLDRPDAMATLVIMASRGVCLRGRLHAAVPPGLPPVHPVIRGGFPDRAPSQGVLLQRAFGLRQSHLRCTTRPVPRGKYEHRRPYTRRNHQYTQWNHPPRASETLLAMNVGRLRASPNPAKGELILYAPKRPSHTQTHVETRLRFPLWMWNFGSLL